MSQLRKTDIKHLMKVDENFGILFTEPCYCGICAPLGMQREVVVRRFCAATGLDGWYISPDRFFFSAEHTEDNPHVCPDGRMHWLLER